MGCMGSKEKQKTVYDRLSQYQLEESRGLKTVPVPLEPEEYKGHDLSLSPRQFHNLFYDGFYAPYMTNPDYLLLVDTRDESAYLDDHILAARWHGHLPLEKLPDYTNYTLIILYDQDGRGITTEDSIIKHLLIRMKKNRLDPMAVCGGINQITQSLPYMVTSNSLGVPERQLSLSWFPSIILTEALWLGRIEQGTSTTILLNLKLTHLIHIGQSRPALAFPGMTCLTVNWNESLKGAELYSTLKGAILFMSKAMKERGRILVLGDQGVNRSATLAVSFLMNEKLCTLEDAFYYVKSLRPSCQPCPLYMDVLSKYEVELFGKKITTVEDLW